MSNDEKVELLRKICTELQAEGRYDLMLQGIGGVNLERLCVEAARESLSVLRITPDYRFILAKWNKEVELSPLHKALYILFLNHVEGIEFKRLRDYADELAEIYTPMCNRVSRQVIRESVGRLTNPLNNAVNEKCSRIKAAFAEHMNAYALRYYIISGHTVRHISGSNRLWFERKKTIELPRELVVFG